MSTPEFDGTIAPVSTKGPEAMNKPARATAAIIVFVVGIAVIVGAVVYFLAFVPETKPPVVITTQPTTATGPASSAPVVEVPQKTYGELMKVNYPRLASTQPHSSRMALWRFSQVLPSRSLIAGSAGSAWW